jgi:tetratricopeptide (TPR) repeat protein
MVRLTTPQNYSNPADRAIKLASDNVAAYEAKTWYMDFVHRWDDSIRVSDAGLAINPNSARLYGARATAENVLGRFEQAKADVQQAMRLSPRDPEIWLWHINLGDAELGLGHIDAAIEEYHKAPSNLDLAAAYGLAGKIDEAKSALAEARRQFPDLTIKWAMAHTTGSPRWLDGLRKAGLPEE